MKEYKLSEFVENPDNPQTVTDEAFNRLVEKIRKNPNGLRANRIAFVTDHPAGKRVVLSGNKRLRALKKIRGESAAAPAEWFQDITAMSEEERREFLVNSNICEGDWDVDKLLEQFDRDELTDIMGEQDVSELLRNIEQGAAAGEVEAMETAESEAFKEKFIPKHTTDACFTPDNIFDAVLNWAADKYGFNRKKIIRPFFPGADYESANYPKGFTVVDNPPFSIFSKIVKFYCERNVPFFLFAPALTLAGGALDFSKVTFVICNCSITYANGAKVATSFITNIGGDVLIDVVPDLRDIIKKIDDDNRHDSAKEIKVHAYPDAVCSCAILGKLSNHHTPFVVKRGDACAIRSLDAQAKSGDTIFGGGFLLSERAAAERAAAERAAAERAAAERAEAERAAAHMWKLSPRELALQKTLGVKP